MKRSDAVKALQEWIKMCDYPCSAWEFVEQADGIIKFLENLGMQPPAYFVRFELPSPVIDDENGFKKMLTVCRYELQKKEGWEPETPPTIIEETINQSLIDQALEHISRNGLRGKLVISE